LTPTLTSTPTFKSGAIGLNGSCAVDAAGHDGAAVLQIASVALALAWRRRRTSRSLGSD